MKSILSMCLVILVSQALLANSSHQLDGVTKFGELKDSETWSGKIYLLGDIIIPKDKTLTITAGTSLYFADYDLLKSGKDESKCEIIVHGDLNVEASESMPVKVFQLNQGQHELIDPTNKTQVLSFEPYIVETESIRQEFRQFKKQYVILWSLVYVLAYTQLTY